jgi:hypothetical protein
LQGVRKDQFIFFGGEKKVVLFILKVFCPQAGLALPFPIDEMSMIHRNTNQNEYFPIMRIPFGNKKQIIYE